VWFVSVVVSYGLRCSLVAVSLPAAHAVVGSVVRGRQDLWFVLSDGVRSFLAYQKEHPLVCLSQLACQQLSVVVGSAKRSRQLGGFLHASVLR
jgi:hypothetical protein